MSPRTADPLTIEYVLLGLIQSRPAHGYELLQFFNKAEGIGMIWRIKPGRLYALLDRLEALGWLISELKPGDGFLPRKEYQISPAGVKALQAWLNTPVGLAHRMRQEFLARLYFARQQSPEAVQQIVERQQQTCRGWLDRLKQEADAQPAGAQFERQVCLFRIGQVQAMLDWLAYCSQEDWRPRSDKEML